MKRPIIALGILLVGLSPGCDRSTTSPSNVIPPPGRPPAPVPAAVTLTGYVSDTAFRPLEGVRVEFLNGPDAGKEFTSDGRGTFSYIGTFPSSVLMRAAKEGYRDATSIVFSNVSVNTASVGFMLSPVAPPVSLEGNYMLTLSLDGACQGFPEEAQMRSYEARLTYHSQTRYDAVITGGQFAPFGNSFFVGVAGDYVGISTEGEGPTIIEQLGPKSYVTYTGAAGATVPPGGAWTISAPFRGVIEYCELKAPAGRYYDCSDTLAAVKTQCTSQNSRLTLTPR